MKFDATIFPCDVMNTLLKAYGIARSALIYRANPLKRRRSRSFYRQFVGPGDLAFDIGAHLGDRVQAWVDLGARVVAVEPQPHLAAVLRRLYGRDPGVILFQGAVGAAAGTAELLINRRNPTLSTLSADWAATVAASSRFLGERWDERVEVDVTTLDALIEAHGVPRFCKICGGLRGIGAGGTVATAALPVVRVHFRNRRPHAGVPGSAGSVGDIPV
jgi:FkbM family methyltransferase